MQVTEDGSGGLVVGERIGRFRLVEPLDQGAMGLVWRVEGPSGPAAMKLLNVDVAGVRERFELEARALLKLRHPNVVRAIDYGHTVDGTPFIAMELLDGEDLEKRLMKGRVDSDEAVEIVCAAARGLNAAHALNIVHRDVKPGNIFLCSDGTVRVLDFGVAFWSEDDGSALEKRITQPGLLLGTPSYMAPEQAAGERNEDVRTDVWGLGAVLYDLVAGRVPFDADENYLAELTRILTQQPDPLPDDVPAYIAAVIHRALDKNRENRFQSMTTFIKALRSKDATANTPSSMVPPASVNLSVMGALSDEVRLVTASLFEGLSPDGHEEFNDAMKRHGAVGSPVRGRRAVAIFGGEVWLGDEPERAVRLALEVRAIVGRIGIGTGKALRRHDQRGVLTGQAVAEAQQALSATSTTVQTLRPPGMGAVQLAASTAKKPAVLFVCPETQRRIRGGFDLIGGRVVGARMGGRSLRPREVGGHEVPFVGRATELNHLVELIEDVDVHDRARAVVITGPPGIGKSRLRFELLRWMADEEFEVKQFEARGEMIHGRVALGIVCQLLRTHAGIPEGTDPARSRTKIEAMVAAAGLVDEDARGTADFIGELLGIEFPANPHLRAARNDPILMADRIRLAIGDLFEGFAKSDLVLILLEDAHWADTASLAMIDSLLEQLADMPVCVLAAARPAFFVEHDALENATRVDLTELQSEHTAAIVERILGHAEPNVVERSGGNPYLAEELSLSVKEGADPDALPLTVEGAVLARLDKLAPDEKDLMKRASVLGRRFWREALEKLGEPLAGQLLVNLRQRELVVPGAESRLEGCEEWLFRHAIVYEVCRGLLTDEQRCALHKAAASWLSRRADASPEEVAEHFETATEQAKALLWWMRAMHAAHARGDSIGVDRFAERVIALSKHTRLPLDEVFAIHLMRCEAYYWRSERTALEEELKSANKIVGENPGAISAAPMAQWRRWQALHVQQSGHLEPALFAARDAARLADECQAMNLRVQARATVSELCASLGQLDNGATVALEALEIAKQGEGAMIRATAARALATIEAQRGNLSQAMFYYKMARDLCMEVGGLREATLNGIGVGSTLTVVGDYEQAHKMLTKTLTAARSLALASVVGTVKYHLGLVLHRLGKSSEGLALEEDALEIARKLDDAHLSIGALQYRSIILRETGHPTDALASAELALEAASRHHKRTAEPLCRTTRAQALVTLGEFEEALAECQLASDARDAVGGMLHSEVELLLARHDAHVGLDEDEAAETTLEVAKLCFDTRLGLISSDKFRTAFAVRVPAHARLASLLERGSLNPTHEQ